MVAIARIKCHGRVLKVNLGELFFTRLRVSKHKACLIVFKGLVIASNNNIYLYCSVTRYLDPSNELDVWLLQQVYLPRINSDLEMFRGQWNNHSLSTEKGKSPLQLFVLGMLKNSNNELTAVNDVLDSDGQLHENVDVVTPDNVQSALGHTRVDVPILTCPLPVQQQQEVKDYISTLQDNQDHGMSQYLSARRFISAT